MYRNLVRIGAVHSHAGRLKDEALRNACHDPDADCSQAAFLAIRPGLEPKAALGWSVNAALKRATRMANCFGPDSASTRTIWRAIGNLTKTQLLARILSGDITVLPDSVGFEQDGLFCENSYWIDFEARTFETSSSWHAHPQKTLWTFKELRDPSSTTMFHLCAAERWILEQEDQLCRFAESEWRLLDQEEAQQIAQLKLARHCLDAYIFNQVGLAGHEGKQGGVEGSKTPDDKLARGGFLEADD